MKQIDSVLRSDALRLAVLLALACFLADWATKTWAVANVTAPNIIQLRPWLWLAVVRNDAFAFSTGGGIPVESIAILRITGLVVAIILGLRFAAQSRRFATGFALLVAGGLGNTTDLFFRDDAVVDFIAAGPFELQLAGIATGFDIAFNIADLWILTSIVLLFPLIRTAGAHARAASEALEGSRGARSSYEGDRVNRPPL